MFSKLTETWYKGTLLYADYGFDVSTFELFALYKLWGQISSQNLLFLIFIKI